MPDTTDTQSRRTSSLRPRDIAAAFKQEQPLLAEAVLKQFHGLRICAEGKVFMLVDMIDYGTVDLQDGVHVSANFRKPLPPEVTLLKRGDFVSLAGTVFNATSDIVVLEDCQFLPRRPWHGTKKKWHETPVGKWVIGISITVAGGLIVAGVLHIHSKARELRKTAAHGGASMSSRCRRIKGP